MVVHVFLVSPLRASASWLIELWKLRTRSGVGDCRARFVNQPPCDHSAKLPAATFGEVVYQQHHSMPARFKLICNRRYLSDVVRDGDQITTQSGKNRQVSSSRQIGTQQSAVPDLELDSQQGVQHTNRNRLGGRAKLILSCSLRSDPVFVDRRDR